MSSQPAWRPLPLPPSTELPDLLISISTGASDYTIRITDMANTWVESLERKAICMRAWGENTTIDPSDTPENMTIFLSAVRSALDPTYDGHDKTSLSLSSASPTDAGEGGLTLRCTCDIPGLKPLEWPIHLRKAASSATATSLVLPLVHAQYSRAREVESLAEMLRDKDRVIGKLVDKLEASGMGVEHVFNPLSGNRKVSRSVAEARVKGLAPFDRSQWQGAMDRETGPDSTGALLGDVFGPSRKVPGCDCSGGEGLQRLDRWWLDLHQTLKIPRGTEPSQPSQKSAKARDETSDPPVEEDDDDFQIQETPPHLRASEKQQDHAADDMPTESDDDDEPSPAPPPKREYEVPEQSASPTRRIGGVGAMGSRKETRRERLEPPAQRDEPDSPAITYAGTIGTKEETVEEEEAPATKERAQDPDGSDTASDVGEEQGDETASEVSESPAPNPPRPVPATSQHGRLGRIGGERGSSPPPKSRDGYPAQGRSPESVAHRPRKLGIIGQGKTREKEEEAEDGEQRGRSTRKGEIRYEPRETSTERADRRREELKRELERKAAAGPSKKKRKF
ncbi:XLF (XRCC4-like factor) [Geosmithia morbida]|uniref:Non-homologous end-joining factor 1 n=1 Tax=Geosmithia morbida TaxID=1094350 RepID=A0A9P4YYS1_9HYPO|nr:XLF (XRCC4-like factor) [Geosmithia morbida]KAF4124992.1 XLF (XRCC4-like factor) [Geosmithia morbida]